MAIPASRSRRMTAASAVALLGLITQACGGDDGDTARAESAASTTRPPSTEAAASATAASETADAPASSEHVKVMLIIDGTGVQALPNSAEANIRGAIQKVATEGGPQIELLVCDTKSTAADASNCARDAVSAGVVMEISYSTLGSAIIPILEEAGIASLNLGFSGEELTAENSFIMELNYPSLAAQVTYLARQGATNIHPVISDLGPATDQAAAIMQVAAELAGVTWDGYEVVPADAADMAPYVEASAKDSVDGIPVTILGPDAATFIVQARNMGKQQLMVGTSSLLTGTEGLGDAGEGVLITGAQLPFDVDSEANSDYQSYMDAVDPDGKYKETFNGIAWAAILALGEALEAGHEPTAAGVLAGISELSNFDTGIIPPMDFTAPGSCAPQLPRQFSCAFRELVIRDGALVALSDGWVPAFATPG